MSKVFPRHGLFAEPLRRTLLVYGTRKGGTTKNLRQSFSVGHYLNMSLCPLQQRSDRGIPPSTRPQTHLCTTRRRFGHSKWGSSGLPEGARGGHTSCITISDISFGSIAKDWAYPVPSRYDISIWILINGFVMNEFRTYLIYHVDKDLCVIFKEVTDRVTLVLAREYCLD